MLNRRYLRIKVLQILYPFFQDEEKNINARERELLTSIDKIYELYIYLFLLLKEIRHFGDNLLEERKKKHLPTANDLKPDLRFINNRVLLKISTAPALLKEKDKRKIGWQADEDSTIKKFYQNILAAPEYTAFMASPPSTFEEEKHFMVTIYKKYLSENDDLKQHLIEKNIHWASDYMLANICIVKTIEAMQEDKDLELMPLYKADDDQDFTLELFRKTILDDSANMKLIEGKIANWEPERIASMDMLLMKMALTEVMNFPGIPVKVTLNEYIEISKLYSSPKSNTFINGILDAIVKELRSQKKVVKVGRGLIE
ncbi:MAG TPA: transcription antitermination protein NusB [Bacteroidia bacterium]|jgi:N utilization substance protein B|nr:transcription antitermination protein NusB [Bacteroidia bacterium]